MKINKTLNCYNSVFVFAETAIMRVQSHFCTDSKTSSKIIAPINAKPVFKAMNSHHIVHTTSKKDFNRFLDIVLAKKIFCAKKMFRAKISVYEKTVGDSEKLSKNLKSTPQKTPKYRFSSKSEAKIF